MFILKNYYVIRQSIFLLNVVLYWIYIIERKNVGLLKKLSDSVAEVDCSREIIFLHYIVYHKVLFDIKHIVDPVVN